MTKAGERLLNAAKEMRAALEAAEDLYQIGLLNASDEQIIDAVKRLRQAALAKVKGAQ